MSTLAARSGVCVCRFVLRYCNLLGFLEMPAALGAKLGKAVLEKQKHHARQVVVGGEIVFGVVAFLLVAEREDERLLLVADGHGDRQDIGLGIKTMSRIGSALGFDKVIGAHEVERGSERLGSGRVHHIIRLVLYGPFARRLAHQIERQQSAAGELFPATDFDARNLVGIDAPDSWIGHFVIQKRVEAILGHLDDALAAADPGVVIQLVLGLIAELIGLRVLLVLD